MNNKGVTGRPKLTLSMRMFGHVILRAHFGPRQTLNIIYHAKSRLNTPEWGSLRLPNYISHEISFDHPSVGLAALAQLVAWTVTKPQSHRIVSLLQHIHILQQLANLMATCCVCRGDLSSGLAKKKRKKLHGLSCKESRRVLEEEVNETLGLGLDGLVETDLDSFICKRCDAKLQKVSELKLQIEHLKSELQSYVYSILAS